MIELKPATYKAFDCPACKSSGVEVADGVFQGIHVLADCRCPACGVEFYHEFPVGNALYYPTVFGKADGKLYAGKTVPWYSGPLLASYREKCAKDISIEKRVFAEKKEVVILNCLDFLYGHVLLKLLNAQYYLDHRPELGLIVIVPRSFSWLVPEGVAEVWLVDVKLYRESQHWFLAFEEFVRQEMTRFERTYLSLAFSVPDFSCIDIARFTRVARFDLARFSVQAPAITFILREDRLWFGSLPEQLLYRICRRLKLLSSVGQLFLRAQSRRIERLFALIREQLPEARCEVVGMCSVGPFRNDLKSSGIDEKVERSWCETYARSHVVIGVHGSNMLLPTAHAAGFIEILPKARYGNMVQDIASPHRGRGLLFLGRFAGEFASPREIADMAVAMVRHYDGFRMYMDYETLRHDRYVDARRFRAQGE